MAARKPAGGDAAGQSSPAAAPKAAKAPAPTAAKTPAAKPAKAPAPKAAKAPAPKPAKTPAPKAAKAPKAPSPKAAKAPAPKAAKAPAPKAAKAPAPKAAKTPAPKAAKTPAPKAAKAPTPENPVLFVGAGPGRPDLITVAGLRAVEAADLLVVAGSLVNPAIWETRRPECRVVDSAPLELGEICRIMIGGRRDGGRVVRLHTGDPALYGAIHEQIAILEEAGVPCAVVPGVTAATAAAARLGLELTMPGLTQTLIVTRAAGRTPVPEGEDLGALAGHGTSLALYLSAGQAGEVSAALAGAHGPDSPVAVCVKVGWPDERIIWTTAAALPEALDEAAVGRHALILAGPAVAARRLGTRVDRSRLYDPSFGHGHRAASREARPEAGLKAGQEPGPEAGRKPGDKAGRKTGTAEGGGGRPGGGRNGGE